jgi:hypothetical protein
MWQRMPPADDVSAEYWSVPQKPFLWQNRQNRHMNSRLPRLTALRVIIAAMALVALPEGVRCQVSGVGAIADTAHPTPETYTGGDKLLMQVATMLERRDSITARLRHQVFLGGRQLYGIGSYWQQGKGADLRVRLELQIAGQDASLLQISNSRFLWIDRRLPTGRSVLRVDLRKLRADPVLGAESLDELEPGNASWTTLQTELVAHSGGLPSLVASLAENFSFLPPQAMRLAPQAAADEQAASIPVFVAVGHWRNEKLLAMLGESGESSNDPATASVAAQRALLNAVPNRLPQEVLLLVGQADLFPYRIEYRRLETPLAAGNDRAPIPYQLSSNPLVVLELSDVAFDVPIAAGQFDYAPGDAEWVDHTAAVLERLHFKRQQQIAARAENGQRPSPVR